MVLGGSSHRSIRVAVGGVWDIESKSAEWVERSKEDIQGTLIIKVMDQLRSVGLGIYILDFLFEIIGFPRH